jgi:hypothetical protein
MGKNNNSIRKKVIKVAKAKKASNMISLMKDLINKAVRHIASAIVAAKPDINGRTPRGFAEKLFQEAKEVLPTLTMNKINYAVKNIKEELKKGALHVNTNSNVSSLTNDDVSVTTGDGDKTASTSNTGSTTATSVTSGGSTVSNNQLAKVPKCNNASKKKTTVKGFIASLTASNATNIVGCLKGSTDSFNRDTAEKMEKATQEAIRKLKEVKSKSKSTKHRLHKGSLQEIISAVKEKYSLPDDIIISTNTVRQRLK